MEARAGRDQRSAGRRRTLALLAAAAVGLGAAFGPGLAQAREFTVSTGNDSTPDGCLAGACTLREAILAANQSPGADVVVVHGGADYGLARPGAGEDAALTGDLDVTDALELVADRRGRATITGFELDRVLDLYAPVKLEGLRITGGLAQGAGGAGGAGVRVVAGRLTLRDTAIKANRGPESALELLGDDGMTARDSRIAANTGAGIVDRGGGGLRAAHTEISANSGNGLEGHGPGGLTFYHGEILANGLRGIQEFDDGDVAAVDAIISANGLQAIDEQGAGSVYVRRSRLRDNGAAGVSEDGDGELSIYRSRLTGSRAGAAIERGPGGISLIKTRAAFNDGLGLSEADKGSVSLEETTLEGSPLGGAVERGEGGIGLTLAAVIDSGGVGLAEFDQGDVALVRSRVRGADEEAISLDGAASLLRSRIIGNGGGIRITSGSLELGRSAIVANSGAIGGVEALDSAVSLRQSTIGRNASDVSGGGLALTGASTLVATNSTIAENLALESGGGLFAGPGTTVSLNAVTIAANRGDDGGGIALDPEAAATLDNSLVARNESRLSSPDCLAAGLVSGGGNLVGDAAGCGRLDPGDVIGRDPRIGPLRPNGGPTSTVALRRASPAIGAAEADAPRRDQRNRTRRDPDSGAFELR